MALDPLLVGIGSPSDLVSDWTAWRERLQALAETAGREKFLAEQLAHNERLDQRRAQLLRSYRQQEQAIDGIAIENIREARRRDLAQRRNTDLTDLEARRTLVPDLKLMQLAWVEAA